MLYAFAFVLLSVVIVTQPVHLGSEAGIAPPTHYWWNETGLQVSKQVSK